MRSSLAVALAALSSLAALPAPAAAEEPKAQPTPVGRWRTVDDHSKKPKSIVAIWEEDGRLQGKIEELLDPNRPEPDPVCKKCEGDRKDQPILGMKILWGMKKSGDTWTGGKILDPNNGKVYRCNLTPVDGGKKLEVRGYVGIALIGRTQTWIREE